MSAKASIKNVVETPWQQYPGHFGGALSKPLVRPETTGSRLVDYRISTYQPMAYVETHSHKVQEQIYHVLEGEGAMEIEGKRPGPGRFARRIFVNRAGTRFYHLYLPKVYRGQALPLVVMLHGCKQTPEEFAAGTRMNQAADELGFIVAYPAQAWRANVERCWNWFRERDQLRERGRRDRGLPDLQRVLVEVGRELAHDPVG